jgi:integrase/recombinase XerD
MERAIQDYVHALASQKKSSENTLGAYRSDLRQLASFAQERGARSWGEVTPQVVAGFVEELNRRQYATTSIARKIAAVKSFFHFLLATGVVDSEPTSELGAPRVEKYMPAALAHDDVERLLAAVVTDTPAGQRDYAMLQCLYATGMRVTELVTTDVADLDLARGHIRCSGRNGRERLLPLRPVAQHALAVYLNDGRRALAHRADEPSLFLNHHGQRLTRQGFWLIMKGYARAAGISRITPHTLRHSFALEMLGRGVELRTVQELLGHANISTTQIYSHLQQSKATSIASVLGEIEALQEHTLGEDGERVPAAPQTAGQR